LDEARRDRLPEASAADFSPRGFREDVEHLAHREKRAASACGNPLPEGVV
jgi:hypothetical protein